jgi:hypothetical protein
MGREEETIKGTRVLRVTKEQVDREGAKLESLKETIRKSLTVSEESLNTRMTI